MPEPSDKVTMYVPDNQAYLLGILNLACAVTGKSESEFLRNLLLTYCHSRGIVNPKTEKIRLSVVKEMLGALPQQVTQKKPFRSIVQECSMRNRDMSKIQKPTLVTGEVVSGEVTTQKPMPKSNETDEKKKDPTDEN